MSCLFLLCREFLLCLSRLWTWLGPMRMCVLSLTLLNGLRIRCCCELWCRLQTQLTPTLLWLWFWLAATAPIQPLAWKLLYTAGVALKRKKEITCVNIHSQKELSWVLHALLFMVVNTMWFYLWFIVMITGGHFSASPKTLLKIVKLLI